MVQQMEWLMDSHLMMEEMLEEWLDLRMDVQTELYLRSTVIQLAHWWDLHLVSN